MNGKLDSSTITQFHKQLRMLTLLGMLFGLLAPLFQPSAAYAAIGVSEAKFSGGTGTVLVGSTLFAKKDATVTLTVKTVDARCVKVSGAFTAELTAASVQNEWTFTTKAPAGDGVQAVTVFAAEGNRTNACNAANTSTQASYTLDNTGPVVTAALTPAPTSFGWNNSDVIVKWTATDTGSGVAAAQPFQTDAAITQNGIYTKAAPAQSDRLGNTGAAGSVTVRLDKAKPSITAAQVKNPDGTTTITFTCDDTGNGGGGGNGEPSGVATCLADGSTTNSKTVQPGATVTGTATDKAGNTATASSTAPAGDTTAPLLSGAPTTQPNGAGWYKGDVTIKWTASDPESGIPTPPADTTITGEGTGLTSSQTVKNGAGLSTTATSSPAVKIDRTAPTTGIEGTSNSWVNGNVTVLLAASDNLSTVAKTEYTVDGGAAQTGTSFILSTDGDHTVTFFSTDNAGNAEAVQTAHVKIDKTAPTISHAFTPLSYKDGAWTNQDVTVTFNCTDQGGSGVASCTAPVTKSTEGKGQQVVGTATDAAGNSATDTATVSIDKTKPVISASADRDPNSNLAANGKGWYDNDVTVSFPASDALSGIASSSAATVLGEGANQSASGTATDKAGNSASASVSGINVDKTDPVLSASFASGWHTGDVTVTWACTDALSGVATGPADDIVKGEGANLSSTASCTDKAGNTATKTVDGIKIDRSNPTTTASVPQVPSSGWYRTGVLVTLTGSDNLSGATTYYTVNGEEKTYTGPFTVATAGTNTVTFWSVDGAGNTETAPAPLTLKVDGAAPTTTVILPPPAESGWYLTSGLPVAFEAKDGTNGSGIAATYYSINTVDNGAAKEYGQPFTQQLADGEHKITFWSVDIAGNVEDQETITQKIVSVKVDTTPPTIKGSQSPTANGAGWNNSQVAVTFTCEDTGSGTQTGTAGCAGDTILANETSATGQMVRGNAVDVAGNKNSAEYGPVKIDLTKPTLSGAATTAPNAAGWYKGDVSVKWTGEDLLSGIDLATQPANSTIAGEGNNLGATATIKDMAGNIGNGSVTGIKIDTTKPSISGATVNEDGTPRAANSNLAANGKGWFNSAVRVRFTATDGLSGIQDKPSDVVITTDGANQSAEGRTTDMADNANSATVSGINIDSKAPQTSANNVCDGKNGWCKGQTATVELSAIDQGLSGVKEIHYVVNGGQEKIAAGAKVSVQVPLAAKSGLATVEFFAVDNAGNVEAKGGVSLKYDNIAPIVTYMVNPPANAAGWNKANTTVHFDATDDDGGSGVDPNTVTPDVTVVNETSTTGQVVTGSASDLVGNTGTKSVTVKLDKTAPSITAAVKSGTKGANGWYTGPVTVGFICTDALSTIATCPADVVLNSDGAGQSASGTAVDQAGNEASTTLSGINIDSTKPVITVSGVKAQYFLGEAHGITCLATDTYKDANGAILAGSGVDAKGCNVTVTGGTTNGVGTFTYTATAVDNAGNVQTTSSATYKVIYKWEGFLQPINDTAHQVGVTHSVFKAVSTVPVKFQLKRVDGSVVQANTLPLWGAPGKGAATLETVSEPVFSDAATSGTTYRWDATGQQYIYNWGTAKSQANYYWRLGVQLDDGQTYYVNIGLR